MDLSSSEWTQLDDLAGRIGYPPEKVTAVRTRLETALNPTPYSLVVGRPSAGIELFLGRWLGNSAADALRAAAGAPLVIGRRPDELRLPVSSPARWKTGAIERGHVVALATPAPLGVGTLAQLGALGLADVAVMVTRLGQPLPLTEREILQSVIPLAATVRVVVVGFAGEEPSEADLADVGAFAFTQMQQAGARLGRILGAGVWIPGLKPGNGLLAHPSAALQVDPAVVAAGRDDAVHQAVEGLLREMAGHTGANTPSHAVPIDEEEAERLVGDLSAYLASLGREVHQYALQRPQATAESLRAFAHDSLHGWRAHTSLGGLWLRYVERLRPGAEAQFYEEVERALPLLDASGPAPDGALTPVHRTGGRLARGFWRAVLTLALGVGALAWARLGLHLRAAWLQGAAEVAAIGAGLLVGQRLASWLFSAVPAGKPGRPAAGETRTVLGWGQVENRLVAWFAQFIRVRPRAPTEELRQLATRLGIQEQPR
jgi:hypothetical protein